MKKASKSLALIASKLTERDISALKSIYDLRCLTAHQIYQLHYSINEKTNTVVADSYSKRKIKLFLDLGIIEQHTYDMNKFCFFLTSTGVDLVRASYNLPNNILDIKRKVVSRGYLRPSELKINNKLIPHQLYLNQFYIDFKFLNLNNTYKYEDAKHGTTFIDVAPDAFLIANDIQFFIEMDLGTEGKKLLTDKWKHYRTFLNSDEFSCIERKTVVLFIIDKITDIEQRAEIIRLTAYEELLDLFGNDFELYIGSKQHILDLLKDKLLVPDIDTSNSPISSLAEVLSNNHDVQSKPAYILSDHLDNVDSFIFFSRFINNGEVSHFLIDEHIFSPMSTFTKIAYFERTQNLFYNIFNKQIYLLILVESPLTIYNELLTTSLFCSNIYFTTRERLDTLEFEQALFQLDISGNLFSFENSLSQRIFKENILNK